MPATLELNPLRACYEAAKLPFPLVGWLPAEALPQPYRSLLVHERDMTSTLESHHQARLHLRVLRSSRDQDSYTREVVLLLDGTDAPVEFGAIHIRLAAFDPPTQALILQERRPLGAILEQRGLPYSSRPTAFFRVLSDAVINEALGLVSQRELYGRCNALNDSHGRVLAEIVEILPPATEAE